MPNNHKRPRGAESKRRKLAEAAEMLAALQFGPRQRNETAAYSFLALIELRPEVSWAEAQAPLRGITPIIDFIAEAYFYFVTIFVAISPR